jgi:hypothetical protein
MSYYPIVPGMGAYGQGFIPQYPMGGHPMVANSAPARHFYILHVPEEHAGMPIGMVIGRGGGTIKSLQSETGGNARFFKSENGKSAYFKITGESTSVVKLAVRITEILCEAKARVANPTSNSSGKSTKDGKRVKKIKRVKKDPTNCRVCGGPYHDGTSCADMYGATKAANYVNSPTYSPHSPTYSPHSPTYSPHSPTYSPDSPTYSPPSPTNTPPSPTYAPPPPHSPTSD